MGQGVRGRQSWRTEGSGRCDRQMRPRLNRAPGHSRALRVRTETTRRGSRRRRCDRIRRRSAVRIPEDVLLRLATHPHRLITQLTSKRWAETFGHRKRRSAPRHSPSFSLARRWSADRIVIAPPARQLSNLARLAPHSPPSHATGADFSTGFIDLLRKCTLPSGTR
jgi:hypothetical protein